MRKSFKLLLVGNSDTGKSSMLNGLLNGKYESYYVQTKALEPMPTMIIIDDKQIKLHIWDSPGHDQYLQIIHRFSRKVQGIILNFDLSNIDSFQDLDSKWFPKVLQGLDHQVPIILVGNKSDLVVDNGNIQQSQLDSFIKKYGIKQYLKITNNDPLQIKSVFIEIIKQLFISCPSLKDSIISDASKSQLFNDNDNQSQDSNNNEQSILMNQHLEESQIILKPDPIIKNIHQINDIYDDDNNSNNNNIINNDDAINNNNTIIVNNNSVICNRPNNSRMNKSAIKFGVSQIIPQEMNDVLDPGQFNQSRFYVMQSQFLQTAFYNKTVQVRIENYSKNSGKFSKYIVYHIQGHDEKGQFQIRRRYKEFIELRKQLRKKWIGMYVPGLPPKKLFGNMKDIFIMQRMFYLNKFMAKLSYINYLWDGELVQYFLRSDSKNGSEDNEEENLTERVEDKEHNQINITSKESRKAILPQYKMIFDVKERMSIAQIESYLQQLKKQMNELQQMKKLTTDIIQSQTEMRSEQITFSSFLFVEYERRCLAQYCDEDESKLIFTRPNDQDLERIISDIRKGKGSNSFFDFLVKVKEESQEIMAQKEAVNDYLQLEKLYVDLAYKSEKLQKKLNQKLNQNENQNKKIVGLEMQSAQIQQEMVELEQLCELVGGQLKDRIQQFQKEKLERFIQNMQQLCDQEIEWNQKFQGLWNLVSTNKNILDR